MRVLLISDTEAKGGAAIAAARMAKALAKAGHQVGMAVNDPQGGPPAGPWQRFVIRPSEPIDWSQVPAPPLEAKVLVGLAQTVSQFAPDAVSVHNIHGGAKVGWSVDMVRFCAERMPTIWTLHDTWSFTGRCAYLDGCPLFSEQCDARCPSTNEYPFLNQESVSGEFARKRAVLSESHRLAAAAPSHWMASLAGQGLWQPSKVHHLPNCLDSNVFYPGDRHAARRELNIATRGKVLLLCAADFDDPRKGAVLGINALQKLNSPLTLLVMGRADKIPNIPGVTVVNLGFVTDPTRQVAAYRAADVMMHPAVQDNLPNTVLESLACGTPVAGFDVGGMADVVQQGKSGYLSTSITPEGLAHALTQCLAGAEALGMTGRTHIIEHFSELNIVTRWTALALTL